MKRIFGLLAGVVVFAGSAWAASGNCEKNAEKISFSSSGGMRAITLVPAFYPAEDGVPASTDYSTGVYYLKATLKRGGSYTIWTEGVRAVEDGDTNRTAIAVNAYAGESSDDDKDGPSADFDEVDEKGADKRLILYASDWYIDDEDKSESDPKEWTYYIEIIGDVGDTLTLHFQQGAHIPKGREDNPELLSPSAVRKDLKKNLELNGEYYCRVRLKAGQMYWFGTVGGTTNNCSLALNVSSDAQWDSESDDDTGFSEYADPDYDEDPANEGVYIIPDETQYFSIVVSGMGPDDADVTGKPFQLSYRAYSELGIADHRGIVNLTADNGYSADFTAGYKNSPASLDAGYYDEIIDESLFRFTAAKGMRYVAETSGARTNLLMRIYDAKGKVLFENRGDGETFNARSAFVAPAAGTYYLGVCQDLANEFWDTAAYTSARVTLTDGTAVDGSPDAWDARDDVADGATGLAPVPGTMGADPVEVDAVGHGWHELGRTDWADTFMIGARKGVTYALKVSLEDPFAAFNTLQAEVFTRNGVRETAVATTGDINANLEPALSFTPTANATYYIRLTVARGQGLDFPKYRVHAIGFSATGEALGVLTVKTKGAAATWSLNRENVKYPGGASVLVSGAQTVKFGTAKGYKVDHASQTVTVASGAVAVVTGVYSDTFDPKDDIAKGATSWTLKSVPTELMRTLWAGDAQDNFSFAGKDGQYYDFTLVNAEGCDAVFSITNSIGDADHPDGVFAKDVTQVRHLVLPTTKTKYYLTVSHGGAGEGSYALSGFFAAVGAVKFAKSAVSVKENAPTVSVSVSRTGKDGVVRVQYGTVAGSGALGARPGVDYIAQNGVLEWAEGDNKPKTITITLIPDLVPEYEGGDKTFGIQLKPIEPEDRSSFEYPALIVDGEVCTITLKEASKAGTTAASSYAAKTPKLATVKTEDVPLETGTFYGVLEEDGSALTNGLPRLASVTFTASTADPAKLSAKVALAGKSYTFTDKGWDVADEFGCEKEFTLAQKVNGVTYTNTLRIAIASGATTGVGDWARAGGDVELLMNVPDANGKGVQEEIVYRGTVYRSNAKIQDYLTAVTNFAGYYTVALSPDAYVGEGVPAGNGYLTLMISNKGDVKIAGMLADGTTKPSLSVKACALVEDSASACGWSMYVPIYLAKSPYCFGGTLRLYRDESGRTVVDSTRELVWNNDNRALTYDNEAGYRIALTPVGGYYDTVISLQTYYLTRTFEVGTIDVSELPEESFAEGYLPYADVQPNGLSVALAVDVFSVAKQALAKIGKQTDLAASVNPCNVQLKVVRATGLVSGSFALWSESEEDSSLQKQVKGLKHYGVLLLSREEGVFDDEIISAGFFTQTVSKTDEDPETFRKTTRKWIFSAPFNLLGIDQGDSDWWADDWGEEPLEL